jgi:2-hydroxy-6-oxo-6-(2'-aminophenyl)hexa-2,4-dienoate hydrolase
MPANTVKTGEITTHYWEDGSGPDVVLLHGGGLGADAFGSWRYAMPELAKQFRVLAYDTVGFGTSDAPDPDSFSYAQASRDDQLEAFMEALGLTELRIVANSLGGLAALTYAIRHPDRVAKLVLMGSAGLPVTGARQGLRVEPTRESIAEFVRRLTHRRFHDTDRFQELVDYRYNLATDQSIQRALEATMASIFGSGGATFSDEAIAGIHVPTLLIHGHADPLAGMEVGLRFFDLLPDVRLWAAKRCGHWAMAEDTDAFVAAIAWFFSEKTTPVHD